MTQLSCYLGTIKEINAQPTVPWDIYGAFVRSPVINARVGYHV